MLENLVTPAHGGTLVNLLVHAERAAELQAASRAWPSWSLSPRQLCDLELLVVGAFSPLRGFMTRADHESVRDTMRLADGTLWPMPMTLDVEESIARTLSRASTLALRDPEGAVLAVLHVEDVWTPDRVAEARTFFGTSSREHPGAAALLERGQLCCVGGRIEAIRLPVHYDFAAFRLTPAELRGELSSRRWSRVVVFQTSGLMHRAHQELTLKVAREAQAHVLIQAVVGMSQPWDVDYYGRVRSYQSILASYPPHTAMLNLLPLVMETGGAREALGHAIVHQNFGCTHFIAEVNSGSPEIDPSADPDHEAEVLRAHQHEIGVKIVPYQEMVYVSELDRYVPEDRVPIGTTAQRLSNTELHDTLASGGELPHWFSFPGVALELRRVHQPRSCQGVTLFFTGLSGSGKSTIANVMVVKLLEAGGRAVTLLDGDLVRRHLSSELGFSREHRDINIRRIGFVAAEITKNGGVAICAPIAPYDRVRREVRSMVEPLGGFILVHVATPLDVCESRDPKGLYAKARAGLIQQFTGISDPYEPPADAEVVIDTTRITPQQAADLVIGYLERHGYLRKAWRLAEADSIEPS